MTTTIPLELTALGQWVCYKLVYPPGTTKATKPPYQPNGTIADVSKPSTWSPFTDVLDHFDGYGFVFTKEDPYIGIDLDHCRDPLAGALTDEAVWILKHCPTYTEISPSGTGLHLIGRGTWPYPDHKRGDIEVYDQGRYFTMTGVLLDDSPTTINKIPPDILQELHRWVFPPKTTQTSSEPPPEPSSPPPVDLLKRMFDSKAGVQIQRLWDGDTSGFPSPSEADLALCSHLAWWTQKDRSEVDRLFRLSGLMRDKWNRDNYQKPTLTKAIDQAGQYNPKLYSGRSVRGNTPGPQEGEGPSAQTAGQAANGSNPNMGAFAEDADPPAPIYIPLPEGVQPNLDLAATACPWLDDYIAYSKHWGPRAAPLLHEAIGVWLLSVVAADRIQLDVGHSTITTLMIAICAPSSVYAKSTTVTLASRLLCATGVGGLLHPDESTPQALLRSMTGQVPQNYFLLTEDQRATVDVRLSFAGQRSWFYEEWGQQLRQMQRNDSPMASLHGLLRRLDDGRISHATDTIVRGLEEIEHPYLSLLTNCTPADLAPYCAPGHAYWYDGFWARFAFIGAGDAPPSRARWPRQQRFRVPSALIQGLHAWHQFLGVPEIMVREEAASTKKNDTVVRASIVKKESHHPTITDAIYDAYDAYDDALAEIACTLPEDWRSCYARYHNRALRIAALLSSMDTFGRVGALEGMRIERPIELKHWYRAVAIVEQWRESHHVLMDHIREIDYMPPSAQDKLEQHILRLLRKGPCTMRVLHRGTHKGYEEILRAITTLEKARVIQKTERGKSYVYALTPYPWVTI